MYFSNKKKITQLRKVFSFLNTFLTFIKDYKTYNYQCSCIKLTPCIFNLIYLSDQKM